MTELFNGVSTRRMGFLVLPSHGEVWVLYMGIIATGNQLDLMLHTRCNWGFPDVEVTSKGVPDTGCSVQSG